MNLSSYSRYKKRVVSTLFLYVIILLLGCDFKSPEEWETPGWYADLTLPLINKEYSFGELLSNTIFYSDTLNVALPSDTVSNVIHLTYNVIMDPLQIPDAIFDIDMSSVKVTIPDFGGLGDSILVPPISDYSDTISIFKYEIDPTFGDCFPASSISEVPSISDVTGSFPFDFPSGNDFMVLRKLWVDNVTYTMQVTNNLPFPVSIKLTMENGDNLLFNTGAVLEGIMPYTPLDKASFTKTNEPQRIDKSSIDYIIETTIGGDPDDSPGCPGWNIKQDSTSELSMIIDYDFGLIDSVRVSTNGINQTDIVQNSMEEDLKHKIYRAKIASSTEDYPSKIFVDIENDFFLPIDIALTFHNVFDSVGINQWDSLKALIEIEAFSESKKDTIDFSEMILSAAMPDPSVSAIIPGAHIKSIDFAVSVNMDSGEGTLDVTHVDDKSYITQTGPKDSIRIGNMSLEYIEAIVHELTFESPSAPIGGIPTGFTDIEFVDIKFGIDLFNEIGIPMSLNLDVVGIRELETHSVTIPNLEIGVPYGTSHNCVFELIGDTARTDILLTQDSLHTIYYCNNDTSLMINDSRDDESSLVDLVNIVPEQFIVNGAVKMNGEGRVTKGTDIWGTFILETPFSFRFKKQMTIIPEDPWTLAPMDDPETSEKINSSLIEGEFFVDITNRSSLGGNLSLLISDSTIFPLFLDSLITGTWDENRQHQITEFEYFFTTDPETATNQPWIWDSLGIEIDSISFIAIDPSDDESKALEVQFFHQDSLQFFVGRMFEIVFPPSDSIDASWGYATPAFPGLYTSSVKLDTTILSWLITDEPRNSTAMITFDGSPFELTDSTYTPVTLQTTNAIEVQAYLTLKLDTGGLIE